MVAGQWSERQDDGLIDLIYDAAFDEALWTTVLEQVADRAGAHPGNLLQIDVTDGRGFGLSARTPEDTLARFFAEWTQRNPIGLVDDPFDYRRDWAPRITRAEESMERGALERTPYWNDFLVPIGAAHTITLRLALRGDDLTSIGLGRPARLGAFTDEDIAALVPFHRHLIRAERIWRSLGLRQAEFDQFDAVLATSPDAMFFLNDRFDVTRWTAAAETLLRRGSAVRLGGGRLRAVDPVADQVLQRALATALAGGAPTPLPLAQTQSGDAMTLSVARLGERAAAAFSNARCLLVVVRPLRRAEGGLRARYGLTGVEEELAQALAAGESLRDVAARRGVSINTVRNQMSAVFDKTGCHRQQDLVRMLAARRD